MTSFSGLSPALLPALVLMGAFGLGAAIQIGTICAVQAVEDMIERRRSDRFLGFLECALWALLVFWLAGSVASTQWSSLAWIALGAALFGLGAKINGGCAFGTIARIGEGRLEFLLTAVGAYLIFRLMDGAELAPPSAGERTDVPSAAPLIAALGLPALMLARRALRPRPWRRVLRLSVIMAAIGILGSGLGLLHQPWPWTTALQQLDVDRTTAIGLFGLVAGSIASGLWQRRFRLVRPSIPGLTYRFAGGGLMALGGALIPGSNDSLILGQLTTGDPRAFLAYAVMLAAIAATLLITRGRSPRVRSGSS